MTTAALDRLDLIRWDLTRDEEEQVTAAERHIDLDLLRGLVADLVNIPSPTGEEAVLAQSTVAAMRGAGLDATYQPIDERQGNAVARFRGSGGGASLLLYAPLDTVTTGNPDEDCPGVGPTLRDDMLPWAQHRDSWVVGLGASNPKGHAACVFAAAAAVRNADLPLRGDLLVGLAAGGMPTNKRGVSSMTRYNVGQGNGCSFLLEQGFHADYAVIAKPGWAVAWEEVGLCWFRIRVNGRFSYVGSRRRIAYSNPLVDAAKLIFELEEWANEYAATNTSGLVAPQAQVGAIEGGWPRMPSFTPASCDLWMDVRISPRTSPAEVRRQFGQAIDRIRTANPSMTLETEMVLSIPGTITSPRNWIVQCAARAWELVEGRSHSPITETSGATDANILRSRGIPTARVGMPKVADRSGAEVDFPLGMNAVDVRDMAKLTRLLIRVVVATCGPSYAEHASRMKGAPA
jgi:acetylornithine deacetylase/succinyl-diaminopimelate desuccinylase-like protein